MAVVGPLSQKVSRVMADEKQSAPQAADEKQPAGQAAAAPAPRANTGPQGTPPRDFALATGQAVRPDLVCLHDSIGGIYSKGDLIPAGVYSEEQEARLVGLGAAEWRVPAGVPKTMVLDMHESAEDFHAAEIQRSVEAAGGDADAVKDAQRAARKAAKD